MSCGMALAMAEWMMGVSSVMIEHLCSVRFSGDKAGLLWMASRVVSVLSWILWIWLSSCWARLRNWDFVSDWSFCMEVCI